MTQQYVRTPLLRYLTAEKFSLLLDDGGIFFSRASIQSDPDEGRFDACVVADALQGSIDIQTELRERLTDLTRKSIDVNRDSSFLSCWYRGAEESKHMWNAFAGRGVVIHTDTWALQDVLLEHAHYIDHAVVTYNDSLKESAIHEPLHFIGERYAHEQEYRAILDSYKMKLFTGFGDGGDVMQEDVAAHESSLATTGSRVPSPEAIRAAIIRRNDGFVVVCDLAYLIREIRVHPGAGETFRAAVQARCRAAGLRCPVRPSMLD